MIQKKSSTSNTNNPKGDFQECKKKGGAQKFFQLKTLAANFGSTITTYNFLGMTVQGSRGGVPWDDLIGLWPAMYEAIY